jgi:hypothetical protein
MSGEVLLAAPTEHAGEGWVARIGPLSALSALPAALVLLAATSLRSRGRMSVLRTAMLLAAVQVPLCALMGAIGLDPLHNGLADPAAWATLAVQVGIALVAAMLLAVFVTGVRLIAARLRRPRPQVNRAGARPPREIAFSRRDLLIRCRRRAPPFLRAA